VDRRIMGEARCARFGLCAFWFVDFTGALFVARHEFIKDLSSALLNSIFLSSKNKLE
jgi:hypothetical protein